METLELLLRAGGRELKRRERRTPLTDCAARNHLTFSQPRAFSRDPGLCGITSYF
jgi:hypothetical protein